MATPTASDDTGIVFPPGPDGRRSSADAGRAVLADALRAVDAQAAARCEGERNWRRRYPVHAKALVAAALAAPAAATQIAAAGLASVQRRMQFLRDGATLTVDAALAQPRAQHFGTQRVAGRSKAGPAPLMVPYRGQMLGGDALRRQLDRWEAEGIVEPSFAQAIWRVQAAPDWLDLSDQRFLLLGAQAELGPLPYLLRWRATVHAVDLPRAPITQKMARLAQAGNGTLCLPRAGTAAGADELDGCGADLVRDAPEIAAWAAAIDGPLTVAAHAYVDGAQHVRVAVAMDAIQARLALARRDLTLALLATPTDAYAVPAAALAAAQARYAARGALATALRGASLGRLFRRNGEAAAGATDATAAGGIVDALVVQQGPNYLLAKRLQHWRALAARAAGTPVSVHVAPPALTRSVVGNRLLARAYKAAWRFGVEAFEPATAAALMAALLVHDLRNPQAAAQPGTPLAHPLQLLAEGACHGGLWRMPYAARSALPVAALIGMLRG